jgi:hypothetical protein
LSLGFENPIHTLSDILVYVVGLSLFRWQALRTGKMPRALVMIS